MVYNKNSLLKTGTMLMACAVFTFSSPAFSADETPSTEPAIEAIEEVEEVIETTVETVEEAVETVEETIVDAIQEADEIIIEATAGHEATDTHGETKEAGLPQFDFSTFPSQIFWLFVFFAVIYVYASGTALPTISGTIENRRRHIQGEIENSESMAEEARLVQTQYEQRLESARTEAMDIVAEVNKVVKDMTADTQERFRQHFENEVANTEQAIQQAKEDMSDDLDKAAAEIVVELSEKVSNAAIKKNKALEAIKGYDETTSAEAA